MKKNSAIIKSLAFIIMFLFVLSLANQYLSYHKPLLRTRIDKIYEEETVVDIAIIGSSHAGTSFNPEMINESMGTETILLASASQDLRITYMLLQELFKERGTKLVVLETFSLLRAMQDILGESDINKLSKYCNVFNEIPFSADKVRMAAVIVEPLLMPDLLIPIVNSHNNWKEPARIIGNIQYRYEPDDLGVNKRPMETLGEEDAAIYEQGDYEYSFNFSEDNKYWLEQIDKLVRENDAKMLAIMAPIYQPFLDHTNYSLQSQIVREELARLEIPFLDLNLLTYLGYDRENFMAEVAMKEEGINSNQHMSPLGSNRVTVFVIPYFADLLELNYELSSNIKGDN